MNKRLTRILGHRVTERPLLSSDSLTHITLLTTAIQFGTLMAQLVRRKLMATITKIKGKFKVQIRRKGYPAITKRFHDLKDARKFARTVESVGKAVTIWVLQNQKDYQNHTAAELGKKYVPFYNDSKIR